MPTGSRHGRSLAVRATCGRPMKETAVPLTVVTSRSEATLIIGLLRSAGIEAFLLGDEAAGQEPQWQLSGVKVMVPSLELGAATEILDDVRRRETLPSEAEERDDDREP